MNQIIDPMKNIFDPNTTFRITWPGFTDGGGGGGADKEEDEKRGGGKGDEDGEGAACGCGGRVFRCSNCCRGLRACWVGCCTALEEWPRCACLQARCCCYKLGRALGGCLAACTRCCGGLFSFVVTCVGCFGMALVVYFLLMAILEQPEDPAATTPAPKAG